jgi:catalase
MSVPADGEPQQFEPKAVSTSVKQSPALSMANTVKDSIKTRKVAILAADGVDESAFIQMTQALTAAGALTKVVAPTLGTLKSSAGTSIDIDFSFLTTASVLFDAVYVPGGDQCVERLKTEGHALHFINEAYKHCKAIAVSGAGIELLRASCFGTALNFAADAEGEQMAAGLIIARHTPIHDVASQFINAIAQHRHWNRAMTEHVPA